MEHILLKNESHQISDAFTAHRFNNCKVIFIDTMVSTSTLLLAASHPWLKELLSELPAFVEQCIILPDYCDFQHFMGDISEKPVVMQDENRQNRCKNEPEVWKYKGELENDDDSKLEESDNEKHLKKTKVKKKICQKSKKVRNRDGMGVGQDDFVFSCDSCQRRFNNILGLELHLRKEHDPNANINPFFEYLDNDEFRCKTCGFVNASRSAMRKHCNKNHLKKKNIKCDQCSKAFFTPKELTNHMKCHSKEKTHFCAECGEGFVYPLSLKRHHLRLHASEEERLAAKNRYQCDTCGFSDMFLNRLKRHMEIHSAVRNYACDKCGKTFTSKHYLQQHHRHAHVLPPQPPRHKTAEQKAREAAKARVYRAIKAGKLPEEYRKHPDIPVPGLDFTKHANL